MLHYISIKDSPSVMRSDLCRHYSGMGKDKISTPDSKRQKISLRLSLLNLRRRYEPRREKTCLWGLRPGPRQTGLYDHRRRLVRLEISDKGRRRIVLSM